MLELLKPRAKRLDEFAALGRFFFTDAIEYDQAAIDKHLRAPVWIEHLAALDAALRALETFDPVVNGSRRCEPRPRRGV